MKLTLALLRHLKLPLIYVLLRMHTGYVFIQMILLSTFYEVKHLHFSRMKVTHLK